MKILFIGDVQGQSNINKLERVVPGIRAARGIDLVVVNGENSADGNGITPYSAKMLFERAGADIITTGNHAFKRKEMDSMFNERAEVIRPENYGEYCPGKGFCIIDFGYCSLCVVNIMGNHFMPACDNPFRCMDMVLEKLKNTTKNIIVDFHAEATAEKKAMAYYLAGKVSAVIGTHTHVQTADEQIIGGHTAFITDVGMVGAVDSVIGANKNVVSVFTDYYPQKHTYAEGESEFNAVLIEIDTVSGRALSLVRIRELV
ncbi:MAG: YmdB family metallophosphoesterase [Oscillospiraceae bacterium]|nr:YmdB family metallophosphoesterase [Oscillospiraceae bacterium]